MRPPSQLGGKTAGPGPVIHQQDCLGCGGRSADVKMTLGAWYSLHALCLICSTARKGGEWSSGAQLGRPRDLLDMSCHAKQHRPAPQGYSGGRAGACVCVWACVGVRARPGTKMRSSLEI